MNEFTTIACVIFAIAIAVETAVWVSFLHRLRARYPQQWLHAAQPAQWQDRTLLSARSTMLYLHQRDYLDSLDWDGMRYCGRHRSLMLAAYWFTAITGVAALTTLALYGW
ncbi:MAG TPA: hypothetical protein VGD21_09055 [Lysobacter sp.]